MDGGRETETEGKKVERNEGRNEEGRKEGRKEERKEGKKEGRKGTRNGKRMKESGDSEIKDILKLQKS